MLYSTLAGDTSTWSKNNDRQYKINVEGTTNMLNAAIEKRSQAFYLHIIHFGLWISRWSRIGRDDFYGYAIGRELSQDEIFG